MFNKLSNEEVHKCCIWRPNLLLLTLEKTFKKKNQNNFFLSLINYVYHSLVPVVSKWIELKTQTPNESRTFEIKIKIKSWNFLTNQCEIQNAKKLEWSFFFTLRLVKIVNKWNEKRKKESWDYLDVSFYQKHSSNPWFISSILK